jgi:uncharacterized protein (TIGR02145 family)
MTPFVKNLAKCAVALSVFCGLLFAQPQPAASAKPKAAVYIMGNPEGRDALRSAVNTFLIKSGKYQMIAVDAIDVMAQKQKRQVSGEVSDGDIAALGRDVGAQYVCVVQQSELDGVSYVATRIVSAQSKAAELAAELAELPRGGKAIDIIRWQISSMLGMPVGPRPAGGSRYTGNGGKVTSLTVFVPQSTGLDKTQSYVPALVQGELVSNFLNYSAISVLDWKRLDDIYVKLIDEAYDYKADTKQDMVLGRLAPTSHFLTGNITKTATGYSIKVNITATAEKTTAATYSGTFTFAELDNLTGVRRASLELLQKLGVELTEKARQELAGAAGANQISAQTALAKGVTAQRQGTEVEALSYFFQAAALDASFVEASKRSSVIAANISSGNIGADVRNDILWRKNWVARLKETEETFYKMINTADLPYELYYSTDIKKGNINYQTETVDLSIRIGWLANYTWFGSMERALQAAQAVLDGFNATNRKSDWGLARWPQDGVSNTNPFTTSKKYDITLDFELVNERGRVIGSKKYRTVLDDVKITLKNNGKFGVDYYNHYFNIIDFKDIRADAISDNLTIRIASINGGPPQNARIAITTLSASAEKQPPLIDSRDGKRYNTVKIGRQIWMAQNLNYNVGNSWCYMDSVSKCDEYGRLYDWNTAMSVCPSGWRLPRYGDWQHLSGMTSDVGRNSWGKLVSLGNEGTNLKSTASWIKDDNGNLIQGTDKFGFSALPGGGRVNDMRFYVAYNQGIWWTATENDSDKVYGMIMSSENQYVGRSSYDKSDGLSVRCVAD